MQTNLNNTILGMARSYEFHRYKAIPYNKTSMTVPLMLFNCMAVKFDKDPTSILSKMSSDIRKEMLADSNDVTDVVGKVSRTVQAKAWGMIIGEEIDRSKVDSSVKIPFANTTMTVPYILFNLIKERKCNSEHKKAVSYIREKATIIKRELEEFYGDDADISLKGKISGKVQEQLWVDFIPDEIKLAYVPTSLISF